MKNFREILFGKIGYIVSHYYKTVIITGIILTFILGYQTKDLRLDMTWISMAPQAAPSVKKFKYVVNKFGGTAPVIVALQGNNKDKLITTAGLIVNDLKKIKSIKEVNYKIDRKFIKHHGLKLQKVKAIKRMENIFSDMQIESFIYNMNNDFEKEYIEENDEPLLQQEKEAAQSIDGIRELLSGINEFISSKGINDISLKKAVNTFSFGEEYYTSPDKKMVLIFVQPSAPAIEINKIIPAVREIEKVLNKYREKYKDIKFGQTGMSVISRDEMDAGMHDTIVNLITAVIAVFLLLSLSFRMWSAPMLAMVSLITGVIWNVGLAALVIGRLNLFTAMVGVILIGLGIDYSIHIITAYTQKRYRGNSIEDSFIDAYKNIGPGILTGALTTAIAFLVFIITKIDSLRELGFVMGTGILATFLSTLFILPALIVLKEKMFNSSEKKYNMEYDFMENFTAAVLNRKLIIILVLLLLITGSIILIPKLHFITDLKRMEMKGLLSLKLADEINDKYNLSPDPAVFTAKSLKETEKLTDKLKKLNSVGYVESISLYLPSKNKQLKRINEIKKLKKIILRQQNFKSVNKQKLIKEIKRLKQNIIELSDMAYMGGMDILVKRCDFLLAKKDNIIDKLIKNISGAEQNTLNRLQTVFQNQLKKNMLTMCNNDLIKLKDIPQNIKSLTISNDGKEYLIQAYASDNIWEDLINSQFIKDTKKIKQDVTGMPQIMLSVIEASAEGGKYATILAFFTIFILVLLDFKNLRFTVLSLIPLVIGSILILGFLVITDINLTWMTVMVVPLIIGIGIDDGVHIIHRYRIERRRSSNDRNALIKALKTTGKAVILTSLTTMIGFGSLVFSKMVGYQQFGLVLFVGIGILLLLSLIILPINLNMFSRKK